MNRFPGVDYMEFDALLTEEQRLVRDSVRAFVDEKVKPIIEECHRDGRTPLELVPEMGRMNLFGATIDEYGLPGLDNVAYGLIMTELERGDSGLRSFVSVQSSLVMYPIFAYGSKAQKDRWIPKMATGEAIGCFGLTEPDFGSNPGGMRTTAKKVGDGWILNGAKQWITNGTLADVAVVWAQTDDTVGGIRGFLVEKGTPGYTSSDQHGKFSLRASTTSELGLHDCHVPDDAILPGAKGLRGPLSCLTQARYGIAWGGLGAAMECYYTALEYCEAADPVHGPADRQPPARAGEARLDDHRDHQGAVPRPADGKAQGRREAQAAPCLDGQAQQRLGGARMRPPVAGDSRRERHRRRLSGHPPHAEHRIGLHLRRHARHSWPGDRRGGDRNRRLQSADGDREEAEGGAARRSPVTSGAAG